MITEGIISRENYTSVKYLILPKLIQQLKPDYWTKTTATDGCVYMTGFIKNSTPAIEHIIIKPNAKET